MDKELINDMTGWIFDALPNWEWDSQDPESGAPQFWSEPRLIKVIDCHYDGGMAQFLQDGSY